MFAIKQIVGYKTIYTDNQNLMTLLQLAIDTGIDDISPKSMITSVIIINYDGHLSTYFR